MSLGSLESNLAEMSITERRAPILESKVIQEIFMNDADIYSAEREVRHYILEVPNTYCGRYYDDEDFIYSKLKLSNVSESMDNMSDIDYLEYMMKHNLIISCDELDLNSNSVMAKVLYIQQYINSYYTSLRHLRPINRIEHMPSDLLNWISNITDTIRILLDKNLFNYTNNETIPLEMFKEMIYGLGLITCHIRLICNHYKARGLVFKDLEEKHLKKIMKLTNNLCVIMIYFWKGF
jgi:hypothetical protein